MEQKKERGITLIALIVTIIVLLILAGVALKMVAGEQGILNRSEKAVQKYESAEAKEEVSLKIMEYQQEFYEAKFSESGIDANEEVRDWIYKTYGEKEIQTTNYVFSIKKEGDAYEVKVEGEKFFITGTMNPMGKIEWADEIQSIEDFTLSSEIRIIPEKTEIVEADVKNNDYEFATIKARIESTSPIQRVTINGKEVKIDSETASIQKDVIDNGNYTIIAYDEDKRYNKATVVVNDLSENLEIWTETELLGFAESIQQGRTYKGKIIKLKENMELGDVQWTPIGRWLNETEGQYFKGIFDGEGHTINELKINDKENVGNGVGFFGALYGGTVKNLNFTNASIDSDAYNTAVVVGYMKEKSTIENVKVLSGTINMSTINVGGICGCAQSNSKIKNCYNNATIVGGATYPYNGGGISGAAVSSTIEDCYNDGRIGAYSAGGGIVGAIHSNGVVQNCYNTGEISASKEIAGGILGQIGWDEVAIEKDESVVKNCYNKGNVSVTNAYAGGIGGKTDSKITKSVENVFNVGTIKVGMTTATNDLLIGSQTAYLGVLMGSGNVTGKYGSFEKETMKNWSSEMVLQNLGEHFKKNETSTNEYLPILSWQMP